MLEKIFNADGQVNWEGVMAVPEFETLQWCEQNPRWHSEGDVLRHTKKCVEEAYRLLAHGEMYKSLDPRLAVAAVLFHDIGKGRTTAFKNGDWHAYGHELESEKIARRILWDEPIARRELICSCARNHMGILNVANSKDIVKDMISMADGYAFVWRYQLFVKHCDILGSVPQDPEETAASQRKIDTLTEIALALGVMDHGFAVGSPLAWTVVYGKRRIDWRDPHGKHRPTVYVMIGLPGAGKNTACEKMGLGNMISRDDIRVELGYCGEGDKVILPEEQEKAVSEVFNERLVSLLRAGKDVCVNNLNLKKKYRAALWPLLAGIDVETVYVYVEAGTIGDNIRRRPTFRPDELVAMTERLDWPTRCEYDRLIVLKQDGQTEQ